MTYLLLKPGIFSMKRNNSTGNHSIKNLHSFIFSQNNYATFVVKKTN